MATKLGQKITDDDNDLIEVKGQQRSNVVIYVIWLPIWSDVPFIQAQDDDILYC